MSYTNAQVIEVLRSIDKRLARLESGAPVGAPATVIAASPLTIPERAEAAKAGPRTACTKHLDHKGGKGFTTNGLAAHRVWCDGEDRPIAAE